MSTKKKAGSKKTTKKRVNNQPPLKEKVLAADSSYETKEDVAEDVPKESLLSNDVVEIKEIIELAPQQPMEDKRVSSRRKAAKPAGKSSVRKKVALFFAILCYPFVSVWKGAQRGTKVFLVGVSLFGVIMTIGVITLSVKLSDTKKELQSVQTMSVSLQEDLEEALDEVAQKDKLLFAKPNPSMTESVRATPIPTPAPTATPVPSPTPAPPKYTVCIDAGHGDWDGGAGYYEKREDGLWYCVRKEADDNLRMAKWLEEALQTYGVEVVMTRDSDVYLALDERTDIANEVDADVLISLHRNSYDGNGEVKGVEFWIHSSKPEGARVLASDMLAAILEVGGMQSRGVKWGSMSSTKEDFAINRAAKMTSMIVELGFISNEEDNAAYDAYGKQYAEGMAEAIFEWLEEYSTEEKTQE